MVDQFTVADAAITFREAHAAWERATARCDGPGGDPALHAECLRAERARDEARRALFGLVDAYLERVDG